MALLEKNDCNKSDFREEHPVRGCVEYKVK